MQQNSALTRQSSERSYYNPITKIRSLIQNLDAELMQLCNQCRMPNAGGPSSSSSHRNSHSHSHSSSISNHKSHFNSSPHGSYRISPQSMLATNSDSTDGVHVRTLSSIYRAKVIDAYRNRRIFTVYGNYHTIRRALLHRGWLEKLAPGRYQKLQALCEDVLLQHARRGNDYEAVAISKIINHFPAFFIWQSKAQRDLFADVLPHRNRVRRSCNLDFSTKVGLIGCAEQQQWCSLDGVSNMSHPRFYRLGGSMEERMSFIQDFRQTHCRSLLRYIVNNLKEPDELLNEADGTISPNIINFAILHVRKAIAEEEHGQLDDGLISNADSETVEWTQFMINANNITMRNARFKASLVLMMEHAKVAGKLLDKLEEKRPDYKWDGYRNLWILKPGYQSRGIGIIIKNSLDDILQWCSTNANRKYIAQKYVERPLLIYKTKFDIRQYMLLSIGESSVSIWMYKDCYLRFSSQEFNIDDLRESIHLTNNSVQKKYKPKLTRDARLPKNNMWSMEQFKLYLKQQNAPEGTWLKIYNGFKENLIAIVMASLEETEFVENAFELYGCDFMLDETYNPILIEVNSTPDLSPSTDVTSRICPMALKDLVKVIVDVPRNSRSMTGLFEMVYEIDYKFKREMDPECNLEINGKAMKLCRPVRNSIFRPKFFRKALSVVKKPLGGNKNNITKAAKKAEKKAMLAKDKSRTSESTLLSKSSTISEQKPLKPFAKEQLAIRYTTPK